ncbi:hypothetical protein EMPS_07628 [Entomortierella parvispora]|uniref:N-acetyltransferase domain-containing protein n=1 Tax=Entomortierella parvispora TaxID=205924 RepID=A0A9P3HEH2_9FUNG|nr:hypothetical protein EMPS_07628 [Entomortierella parvispora]
MTLHFPPQQSTQLESAKKKASDMTPEEFDQLAQLHDSFKPLWVTPTIQAGPILPSDKDDLVGYMNDERVYSFLIGPPNPYLPEHADHWIRTRVSRMTIKGSPLHLALRDMEKGGKLIGSVGCSDELDENLDGDDTGYWLSPDYHGQGIMAKALRLVLQEISIKEVGKRKYNSCANVGNWASRKTMEKVGFVVQPDIQIGLKDGVEVHQWRLRLYLTEEDLATREVAIEATPLPSLVGAK